MWKNVILTHFEMNPVTMGMSFFSSFAFYNFFFHLELFFRLYPSNYICGQLYSFWSTHWLFSHNTNLGCWPQLLFSEIRAWKTWNHPTRQFLSALWSWNYRISLRDYPVNQANMNTIHPKRLVSIHCVSSHNCICLKRAPIIYCNPKSKHRELSLFLLVCN